MQNNQSKTDQFNSLYKDHKDKIYRLCYGYLHNKVEIEDLFQQVMLNIWENLESFRGEAQLTTWVYRVTVNTAITYSKKHRKLKNIEQSEVDFRLVVVPKSEGPDYDPLPALRQLHKCIHKLEKQERIIISLYLEDLRYEEIADVVGISANYVGVKINRVKKKLQLLMQEQ